MTHSELLAAIQLACSNGETRLFRINSGVAWQGQIIEHTPKRLVILGPRAIRMGIEGMADLIGWTTGGRFVALEAKTGDGRASAQQRAFLKQAGMAGCIEGIVRSVGDARMIIQGGINADQSWR